MVERHRLASEVNGLNHNLILSLSLKQKETAHVEERPRLASEVNGSGYHLILSLSRKQKETVP